MNKPSARTDKKILKIKIKVRTKAISSNIFHITTPRIKYYLQPPLKNPNIFRRGRKPKPIRLLWEEPPPLEHEPIEELEQDPSLNESLHEEFDGVSIKTLGVSTISLPSIIGELSKLTKSSVSPIKLKYLVRLFRPKL